MDENSFEKVLDRLIDKAIGENTSRQDIILILEAKIEDLREEISTITTTKPIEDA